MYAWPLNLCGDDNAPTIPKRYCTCNAFLSFLESDFVETWFLFILVKYKCDEMNGN